MLTLILAATLSQITLDDYCFVQAQENFIIDNLPKDKKAYSLFVPAEILERVKLWEDECWRCRRTANIEIIKMGEPAIRWMMWTARSTNLQIRLHSEACLRGLVKCSFCNGRGEC